MKTLIMITAMLLVISCEKHMDGYYGNTFPGYDHIDNVQKQVQLKIGFNSEYGTAKGQGMYKAGSRVQIKAHAYEDHRFVEWMHGEERFATEPNHTFFIKENMGLHAKMRPILANTLYESYQNGAKSCGENKSFTPWDDYYMMLNEIWFSQEQVADYLDKGIDELIGRYVELRSSLDNNVVLDVMIAPEGYDMYEFMMIDHTLEDYEHYDIPYIYANVGDVIKVNVRALSDDFAQTDEIAFFHRSGAVNTVYGKMNFTGNDTWGSITTVITGHWHTQIGIMCPNLTWAKPLLIVVN